MKRTGEKTGRTRSEKKKAIIIDERSFKLVEETTSYEYFWEKSGEQMVERMSKNPQTSYSTLFVKKMKEVNPKDIDKLRKKNKPYLIYKKDGKFYVTDVARTLRISDIEAKGCRGCSKTMLEDCRWISEGYETFFTYDPGLVAVKCNRSCKK